MKNKSKNAKCFVGVDVGGTKIAAGLVDTAGKVIATKKIATPPKGSGPQIFLLMEKLIKDLLADCDIQLRDVLGLGVGVPGIVKPNHRDILITPNVKLSGFPLAEKLEKAFQTHVVLGNDVNLGLLGAQWQGIAKDVKNVIGLFPGTGVGGAIIIDGHLICGAQGAAGELGHMIMQLGSDKQSAGVRGSLEALASRSAIERDIKARVEQGEKTIITQGQDKKSAVIKSGVIARALSKKDALTMDVIDKVCEVLGQACISIRHIFNPDMIILGGGVIEACGEYMLPRIRKISASDPFFKGIDHCKIKSSILGDDAVILGAVALVKQNSEVVIDLKDSEISDEGMDPAGDMHVREQSLPTNGYIRADGKIKSMDDSSAFNQLRQRQILDISALKKICKKRPSILMIGSGKNQVKISKEGQIFLEDRGIAVQNLTRAEAIKQFNTSKEKKALVVSQEEGTVKIKKLPADTMLIDKLRGKDRVRHA